MSKRKSKSKGAFDISGVLAAPVRAVENGKQKNMPPFEAEIRQHLAKALKNKCVVSMKYLFGQAARFGVIKKPTQGRTSGVVVIPKDIPESCQKEIFDWQPEPGQRDPWVRIVMIIARWFEERDGKGKACQAEPAQQQSEVDSHDK